MRTHPITVALMASVLLTAVGCVPAQVPAQPEPDSKGVVEELVSPGPNMVHTLSVVLIFGTGLVASLLWGLSKVIAALRSDAGNSSATRDDVAALEQRVAAIERALGATVGADEAAAKSH